MSDKWYLKFQRDCPYYYYKEEIGGDHCKMKNICLVSKGCYGCVRSPELISKPDKWNHKYGTLDCWL